MTFSAVFAVSATLAPKRRMISIIRSMPKVMIGPGRTRAIQSKRSNGTNGRPTILSARYIRSISGVVSSEPASTPVPMLNLLILASPTALSHAG